MWRFSKKDIGSRIRWRNSRAPSWKWRTFCTTSRISDRIALRRDANQHQETEPERQHDEKVDVAARDDLVDGDLHVKGRGEHQDLQDDREDEDLDQRMAAAAQLSPENRERQPCALVLAHEAFRWRKLERDAASDASRLRQRKDFSPEAGSWIDDPFSGHGLENHEVAHVPVQDGRQPELAQVLHLEPQRPAEQVQMARDLDEGPQA